MLPLRPLRLSIVWLLAWSPAAALAQRVVPVGTGTTYTFWEITGRIVSYLAGAIGAIAVAMFVVGAFFVTLSGVKDDLRQQGKNLIIGAILSLAVVLGSYAILRTVDYFLGS